MRLDVNFNLRSVDANGDTLSCKLDKAIHFLNQVLHNEGIIMSGVQDVNDALAVLAADTAAEKIEVQGKLLGLTTEVQTLNDKVQALSDQIASGNIVSQADLDNLVASIQVIDASVKDISEPVPVV